MWRLLRNALVPTLILMLVLSNSNFVQAARGEPGSLEFGIGTSVHPEGPFFEEALDMAAALEPDWISVSLSWELYQPVEGGTLELEKLDRMMEAAARLQSSVLLSLTDAPAWAQTPSGPNPEKTGSLLTALAQRYPQALRAVELFPGANTRAGWRAKPDPQAYAQLFQSVEDALRLAGAPVLLVAAGLRLQLTNAESGDMSDLAFLEGLYDQGLGSMMSVVSLQYDDLTGSPADFPESADQRVLRHYEMVRQVMVENGYQNGSIWITRLCLPSGKIDVSDSMYHEGNARSNWLSLAYVQLRGQLYIGVAFGQSLNPSSEGEDGQVLSLIDETGEHQPFATILKEMISLNKSGNVSIVPGKPKEGNLPKNRP